MGNTITYPTTIEQLKNCIFGQIILLMERENGAKLRPIDECTDGNALPYLCSDTHKHIIEYYGKDSFRDQCIDRYVSKNILSDEKIYRQFMDRLVLRFKYQQTGAGESNTTENTEDIQQFEKTENDKTENDKVEKVEKVENVENTELKDRVSLIADADNEDELHNISEIKMDEDVYNDDIVSRVSEISKVSNISSNLHPTIKRRESANPNVNKSLVESIISDVRTWIG